MLGFIADDGMDVLLDLLRELLGKLADDLPDGSALLRGDGAEPQDPSRGGRDLRHQPFQLLGFLRGALRVAREETADDPERRREEARGRLRGENLLERDKPGAALGETAKAGETQDLVPLDGGDLSVGPGHLHERHEVDHSQHVGPPSSARRTISSSTPESASPAACAARPPWLPSGGGSGTALLPQEVLSSFAFPRSSMSAMCALRTGGV
jgi:hypothetical protein